MAGDKDKSSIRVHLMNLPDNYAGAKVIERLAYDLQREFPDIHGFSRRNLLFMRAFAEAYPEPEKVKQLVSQIPWGHIVRLIQTVKDSNCRNWYILQTIQNCWSRSILEMQIENDLYHRHGKAITNFERTLPSPQSDLAQQITKDPYVFDFLSMRDIKKPVGVSGYITKLVETLPKKSRGALPSPEEIEEELSKADWKE